MMLPTELESRFDQLKKEFKHTLTRQFDQWFRCSFYQMTTAAIATYPDKSGANCVQFLEQQIEFSKEHFRLTMNCHIDALFSMLSAQIYMAPDVGLTLNKAKPGELAQALSQNLGQLLPNNANPAILAIPPNNEPKGPTMMIQDRKITPTDLPLPECCIKNCPISLNPAIVLPQTVLEIQNQNRNQKLTPSPPPPPPSKCTDSSVKRKQTENFTPAFPQNLAEYQWLANSELKSADQRNCKKARLQDDMLHVGFSNLTESERNSLCSYIQGVQNSQAVQNSQCIQSVQSCQAVQKAQQIESTQRVENSQSTQSSERAQLYQNVPTQQHLYQRVNERSTQNVESIQNSKSIQNTQQKVHNSQQFIQNVQSSQAVQKTQQIESTQSVEKSQFVQKSQSTQSSERAQLYQNVPTQQQLYQRVNERNTQNVESIQNSQSTQNTQQKVHNSSHQFIQNVQSLQDVQKSQSIQSSERVQSIQSSQDILRSHFAEKSKKFQNLQISSIQNMNSSQTVQSCQTVRTEKNQQQQQKEQQVQITANVKKHKFANRPDKCSDLLRMYQEAAVQAYRCQWRGCAFICGQRPELVKHMRKAHFKLPNSFWESDEVICLDGDGNETSSSDSSSGTSPTQPEMRPSLNLDLSSPRWWGDCSICRCTWPDCEYVSVYRGNVKKHIRMVHFQLPATLREQRDQNIEDDRDPRQFLAVE